MLFLLISHARQRGLMVNIFGCLFWFDVIGAGDVLEIARGLSHHF